MKSGGYEPLEYRRDRKTGTKLKKKNRRDRKTKTSQCERRATDESIDNTVQLRIARETTIRTSAKSNNEKDGKKGKLYRKKQTEQKQRRGKEKAIF